MTDTALMWLGLIAWFAAVARATIVITDDAVFDAPREWIMQWSTDRAERKAQRTGRDARATLRYFITCPWCVSIWVAAGTVFWPVLLIGAPWSYTVVLTLAASLVTGMIAKWTNDDMQVVTVE